MSGPFMTFDHKFLSDHNNGYQTHTPFTTYKTAECGRENSLVKMLWNRADVRTLTSRRRNIAQACQL